jgi:branched-chain amino acid transport system substrate-binding protein
MANPHMAGLEFAVDEINSNGGVLGKELKLVEADSKSSPVDAVNAFTRLVEQEGIVAATGTVFAAVAVRVGREAENQEVPVFHHAAGSPGVLSKDRRYNFRTVLPPAHTDAYALSQMIAGRDLSSGGAIMNEDGWGGSFNDALPKYLPDRFDLSTATTPSSQDNFTPFLREFPSDVETVIATSHPPGIPTIFGQQFQVGLDPSLTTGAIDPSALYFNAMGEKIVNGFSAMTTVDLFSDEYKQLASQYHDETGEYFDIPVASGYVAAKLIAKGLEESGSVDPTALADTMRGISFDTILTQPINYTDWGELKDMQILWYKYQLESPDHTPDLPFKLVETFRTDPLPAFDPRSYQVPPS